MYFCRYADSQALNEADVFPAYGDSQLAWSPLNPGTSYEFLEVLHHIRVDFEI